MASPVPAKSQPLHTFHLSHLKWKGNHQRQRSSLASSHRLSAYSHDSPTQRQSLPQLGSPLRGQSDSVAAASPSRHSPMRVQGSAASPMRPSVSVDDSTAPPPPPPPPPLNGPSSSGGGVGKLQSSFRNSKPWIEYRRQSRNSETCSAKKAVFISTPDRDAIEEKSEKKLKETQLGNKESRSSKILIKIRQKTGKVEEESQVEDEGSNKDNEDQEEGKLLASFDDEEPLPKTWNFRPRKPIRPSLNLNEIGFKNNGSTVQLEKRAKSAQVNPNNRSEIQKKEKRKIGFTLTLSREDIEEDMFSLMGSKPSRRPKKRSKTVQKLIDNVFPGAWLEFLTADSYKVSEHPGKG